jgi:hypothetical protein
MRYKFPLKEKNFQKSREKLRRLPQMNGLQKNKAADFLPLWGYCLN